MWGGVGLFCLLFPQKQSPKEADADQFLPKVAIHPSTLLEDWLTCLFVTLSSDLMLFFFFHKMLLFNEKHWA